MEIFEAIKDRRSIRQQKPDSIDDETLQKILEAARWAPSWANTQTWRFVVVRDNDIKTQLAGTRPQRPPGPPPGGVRPDGPSGPPATASAITQAPLIIVVCAELGKAGVRPDGTYTTDKGDTWYMYDTALATQNLVLAAHALGVGTVIMGAFDAKKAAEILGVPEGYCVVVMIPLGFPAQEGRPPTRKELSEIVFYDKFQA
ncbi:MAG: nitroreductase family protein [Dehalococcoidales bacterium]